MKHQLFFSSLVISIGIVIGAFFVGKNIRSNNDLIEVRGLSEKIIKSDLGEISIKISNKDEDIENLYKKMISDKEKIIKFLKENGVVDSEIICVGLFADESTDYDLPASERKKIFRANDSIQVSSNDIEKILRVKSNIIKLIQQKIFISYYVNFKLTNFSKIQMEMMKEASEKAKESAEAFIAPHGKKVGDVAYLRQGEITIKSPNDQNDNSYYDRNENISVDKKLRLIVRAGFYKKD